MTEKKIEDQLAIYLDNIELGDVFITWTMKYLNYGLGSEFDERQKLMEVETKKLQDLQISFDRLTKLYINPTINANGEVLNAEQFALQ